MKIIDFYLACLYELYGESFLQPSSTNDCYINWFLQSKFRINDDVIGPNSNQQYLESLFFGTYRYILKQLMTKNSEQNIDRYHSIMIRCSCLTTIIRNLSFIEENEYLANDRCLLDILERILNCHHQDMHQIFDYESSLYTCSNCSDLINIDDTQLESSLDSTIQVSRSNQHGHKRPFLRVFHTFGRHNITAVFHVNDRIVSQDDDYGHRNRQKQ